MDRFAALASQHLFTVLVITGLVPVMPMRERQWRRDDHEDALPAPSTGTLG